MLGSILISFFYIENRNLKGCMNLDVTVALFTLARKWKKPKYPSTEEWIKKMCYIYTWNFTQPLTRNKIMQSAATWMDLEIIIQSEVSQKEKDRYCIISLKCEILKKGTDELTCKAKIESQM